MRVDVGRRTVGYLRREVAVRYRPALDRLSGTGWCVGRVTGGGERNYGIYLHLAPPDAVMAVNQPGDVVVEGDRRVTVTKPDQEVVAPLTQGVLLPASVFVTLHRVEIVRGKYAGLSTLEARVDGRRVGEVTRRMAERYEALVPDGAGCEAVIQRGEKGFGVFLMLPTVEG